MAYDFDWRKTGILRSAVQGHVHLLGPLAKRNLYGKLCLLGPELRRDGRRDQHVFQIRDVPAPLQRYISVELQ